MKTIGKSLVVIAVLLVCMMVANQTSADTYSGLWNPNDKDMFAIQVSWLPTGGSMFMYDFDTPSNSMLLVKDTYGSQNTINFSSVNGSWLATTAAGGSLNLGSTEDFGFYFTDPFGAKFWSYDLNVLAPGDTYELSAAGLDVIVHDASVPEPTTMILLGAGLLGFVFFGRRLKKV